VATAYQFIYGRWVFAGNRLQAAYEEASVESAPEKSLDCSYLTVLDKCVSGYSQEHAEAELFEVLYTVIATISVMVTLLDVGLLSHFAVLIMDWVNKVLFGLHSIYDIPESEQIPTQLHHTSFRNFIVDLNRCDDIRCFVDTEHWY
jgi:hypothetical protein